MKLPAWYYMENGHQYRARRPGDMMGKGVRVCVKCGVASRSANYLEWKRLTPYTLFVCRDRQAMLFAGTGKRVGGWSIPAHWSRYSK